MLVSLQQVQKHNLIDAYRYIWQHSTCHLKVCVTLNNQLKGFLKTSIAEAFYMLLPLRKILWNNALFPNFTLNERFWLPKIAMYILLPPKTNGLGPLPLSVKTPLTSHIPVAGTACILRRRRASSLLWPHCSNRYSAWRQQMEGVNIGGVYWIFS